MATRARGFGTITQHPLAGSHVPMTAEQLQRELDATTARLRVKGAQREELSGQLVARGGRPLQPNADECALLVRQAQLRRALDLLTNDDAAAADGAHETAEALGGA